MVARMIVTKSQNLVKELQENVKEIYAALFFFLQHRDELRKRMYRMLQGRSFTKLEACQLQLQ